MILRELNYVLCSDLCSQVHGWCQCGVKVITAVRKDFGVWQALHRQVGRQRDMQGAQGPWQNRWDMVGV